MAQAIVTVLLLLVFVGYAVFFAIWNPGTIMVVSLYLTEGMSWGGSIPLFVLPLAGVLVGAIVMALAVSAPWSSLKSKLVAAEDQLDAERTRSKECQQRLQALRNRVEQAQRATPAVAGKKSPSETVEDTEKV